MNISHRKSFWSFMTFLLILLTVVLTACGETTTTTNTGAAHAGTSTAIPLKNVSIGLGYIPNIQFAPFYVAQSKGYYSAAGLNVTFHHGFVNDVIGSMVLGHDTFAFATGDEALVARSKNLPVVNVATIYQRYPVSLIVPANSPIHTLADLKGHSIGEPAPYGATHIGLLALLYQAHLTPADVHVTEIGFTQVTALLTHKFDAVVGYSNNEPIQLSSHGMQVRTFDVSDYQPLISNGIITTENTLHNEPEVVRSYVQATIKGLKEVIANPQEAVQISQSYVQGMDPVNAMSVLKATIPIWQGDGQKPLGYNDESTWKSMEQFLVSQNIIPAAQDVSQAYTNASMS